MNRNVMRLYSFVRGYEALRRDLYEWPSWRTWHPDKQQFIQAWCVRQHMPAAVLTADAAQAIHTPLHRQQLHTAEAYYYVEWQSPSQAMKVIEWYWSHFLSQTTVYTVRP